MVKKEKVRLLQISQISNYIIASPILEVLSPIYRKDASTRGYGNGIID